MTKNSNPVIGKRVKCIMGARVNQMGTVISGTDKRYTVEFDNGTFGNYNAPGTLGAGVVHIRGRRPAASVTVVKKALRKARIRKAVAKAMPNNNTNKVGARMRVQTSRIGKWFMEIGTVVAQTKTRYQLALGAKKVWYRIGEVASVRGRKPKA
jgi:hypothetical protein